MKETTIYKYNEYQLIRIFVFLFPVMAVSVRHWSSSIFGLLILASLYCLFSKRKLVDNKFHKEEYYLVTIFVLYFIVFLVSSAVNGWGKSAVYGLGTEVRFLLIIPFYYVVRDIKGIEKSLLIGSVLAVVVGGLQAYYDVIILGKPQAWGLYGHLFIGPVTLLMVSLLLPAIRAVNIPRKIETLFPLIALIGLFAVLTSQARSAYLACIIVCLISLFYYFPLKKVIILFSVGITILVLSYFILSLPQVPDKLYTGSDEDINKKEDIKIPNLFSVSEQFENKIWGKYTSEGNTISVIDSNAISPTTDYNAATVSFNIVSGQGQLSQRITSNSPVIYTASIWIQYVSGSTAAGKNYWQLRRASPPYTKYAEIDLSPYLDGVWHRISVSGKNAHGRDIFALLQITSSLTLNVWGGQLEQSSSMGRYVKTELKPTPYLKKIEQRLTMGIHEVTTYFDQLAKYPDEPNKYYMGSLGTRLEMWRSTQYFFRDSPWFGVGRFNFPKKAREYVDQGLINQSLANRSHPHNAFIGMLMTKGIFGLISLLLLLYYPLYVFIRTRKTSPDSAFAGIMLITCISVFSLTETSTFTKNNFVAIYTIYLAIFFSWHLREIYRDKKSAVPQQLVGGVE